MSRSPADKEHWRELEGTGMQLLTVAHQHDQLVVHQLVLRIAVLLHKHLVHHLAQYLLVWIHLLQLIEGRQINYV